MRGIKPFKLSFLTRPFQWGNEHRLGIGILAYIRLGEPELFTDFEMWKEVAEAMGKDFILDTGLPKSRAEFLMMGTAYQPGGVPATTRSVKVKVGSVEKSVYVIGDRFWKDGVPTSPLPFTEMPLTWENAFGGAEFPRNPRGKGAAKVRDGSREIHPLPNLELPGRMITSPRDKPEPAGFGAIDFMWPQRFSLAGTYDKEWLDTRFPGFAQDLDWRIWNLAPPDQQQAEPFSGDETIVLEHVHPTKPRIEARLPPLKARCFVDQRRGEERVFEEVAMKLTTLWLFPELERAVLVFHGAHPIVEDDGTDIETLLIAGEKKGEPRPVEHYRAVLEKRSGPDRALEVLNDPDLVPDEWAGMGPEVDEQTKQTTPNNFLHERQRKVSDAQIEEARAKVVAVGLDPDEHGPKPHPPDDPLPPLAQLGEYVKRKMAEGREALARAQEERAAGREKARKFYEEVGLDFDEVVREMATGPRGPPDFSADAERVRFRKLADDASASGHPIDELEHFATDEGVYAEWKAREAQLWELYRTSVHRQEPAFPASDERTRARVAAVQDALGRGESLAGWDLTGVDLRGVELVGANLEGAFLESTRLEGANLEGANLKRAVLAHAQLEGARLARARLEDADLGGAALDGASLSQAVLTGAELYSVSLRKADLTGANLYRATFQKAELEGACFRDAKLLEARFLEVKLPEVDLRGADLTRVTFVRCNLGGLDVSGANLEDATFVATTARGTIFVNARLVGMRVVEECCFAEADFKGADLSRANLRDTDIARADFSGATLHKADLSGADLTEARFYRARARSSLWIRTKLNKAMMVAADLFEAVVEKADMRGTDLRGANLYGADFALIHSDRDTKVDDAIQDRVRVLPLRGGA